MKIFYIYTKIQFYLTYLVHFKPSFKSFYFILQFFTKRFCLVISLKINFSRKSLKDWKKVN